QVETSATITTGTFTRKTEPHQKCSSRKPPVSGPSATPRPDTPAQIPIARGRSSGGKTLVRIDNVDGMMNAPPSPMIPRITMSCVGDPTNAEIADPEPKTSNPTISAPRRPNLSPMVPAVSNRLANTRV